MVVNDGDSPAVGEGHGAMVVGSARVSEKGQLAASVAAASAPTSRLRAGDPRLRLNLSDTSVEKGDLDGSASVRLERSWRLMLPSSTDLPTDFLLRPSASVGRRPVTDRSAVSLAAVAGRAALPSARARDSIDANGSVEGDLVKSLEEAGILDVHALGRSDVQGFQEESARRPSPRNQRGADGSFGVSEMGKHYGAGVRGGGRLAGRAFVGVRGSRASQSISIGSESAQARWEAECMVLGTHPVSGVPSSATRPLLCSDSAPATSGSCRGDGAGQRGPSPTRASPSKTRLQRVGSPQSIDEPIVCERHALATVNASRTFLEESSALERKRLFGTTNFVTVYNRKLPASTTSQATIDPMNVSDECLGGVPALSFLSADECGNLGAVVRVVSSSSEKVSSGAQSHNNVEGGKSDSGASEHVEEYDIWVVEDCSPKRHTGWFYFGVEGAQPGSLYRFTIRNLRKAQSLLGSGQLPLCRVFLPPLCSHLPASGWTSGGTWTRASSECAYFASNIYSDGGVQHGHGMSLSFMWRAPVVASSPGSSVSAIFAPVVPYCTERLSKLVERCRRSKFAHVSLLTETLGGQPCWKVFVSSSSAELSATTDRPLIVVTARVHPGEAPASFVMEAFTDWLLSAEGAKLRDGADFLLVPNLNPDGCKFGMERTNLAGRDLNREYQNPTRRRSPTILQLKKLMVECRDRCLMFLDIHGHTRKKGCFFYGCRGEAQWRRWRCHALRARSGCTNAMWAQPECGAPTYRLWERVVSSSIPFIQPSSYKERGKEATGRVVCARELGIPYSFTFEISHCGPVTGKFHFGLNDYKKIGRGVGLALQKLMSPKGIS